MKKLNKRKNNKKYIKVKLLPWCKGKLFFIAEPVPVVIPKTREEIEEEKYDTLQKIVDQLEFCNYQTKDGLHSLKDNSAFIVLKKRAAR